MRFAVLFVAAFVFWLPVSAQAAVNCGPHAHYVRGHRDTHGHYIKGRCIRDAVHHDEHH